MISDGDIDKAVEFLETWKTVDSFEMYEVSDLGRVRRGQRILSGWLSGNGYWMVGLCVKGQPRTAPVHVLVAGAFIGCRPSGHDVCHGDGNKENNRASNLRYDTRSENMRDGVTHGVVKSGERHPNASLSAVEVEAIRAYKDVLSAAKVASRYGVHRQTIYRIWQCENWKQ